MLLAPLAGVVAFALSQTAALRRECADPELSGRYTCPEKDVEEEEVERNLDYPVEAQPDTEESRSAMRIRAWVGGGAFGFSGAATEPGPFFMVGKPLFLFTRHRHFQGVVDAHISAMMGFPSREVALVFTPQMGINWYLGPYFGLEGRIGFGFGALLSSVFSRLGVGVAVEGAVVLRPFRDDRARLKLGVIEQAQFLFGGPATVMNVNGAAAVGFEWPI